MESSKAVQRDFNATLIFRVGSTISYQMMMVAIGWHLFDITNSVISLGLLGLAEIVPFFICSLFAGHIVDTYSRRVIATFASILHLVIGIFLMYVARDVFSPAEVYIYVAVAFLGVGRSLLRPAYQSIFGQVIPRELTPKYSAYASATFQACVVSGPALSGFCIATLGLDYTYLIAGLFALFGQYGIFAVKLKNLKREKNTAPFWESFLEGIYYVKNHRLLLSAMSIDLLAILFGGAISMLPAFVKEVLNQGPETLGLLRAAPAITDVLGGHVDGFFGDIPGLIGNIKSGKLKALGIAAPKRSAALPEVKTFAEMGVPGVDSNNWYALFVKAGTSKAEIERINAAIKKVLAQDDIKNRLLQSGTEPVGSSPEELANVLKNDINKWTKLIKAKNIKPE